MQQTFPKIQELEGLPPKREHTDPGAQIPASPVGDVQVSKISNMLSKLGLKETGIRLARLARGLHVLAGVNLLLKKPAFIKLAPKPPRAKRPSDWKSFIVDFNDLTTCCCLLRVLPSYWFEYPVNGTITST